MNCKENQLTCIEYLCAPAVNFYDLKGGYYKKEGNQ
jgi:hypothetical protein